VASMSTNRDNQPRSCRGSRDRWGLRPVELTAIRTSAQNSMWPGGALTGAERSDHGIIGLGAVRTLSSIASR
jgi:hypothetical protein